MTTQTSLYDLYQGLPPHVAGDTSTGAAVAIKDHVGRLQQVFLDWFEGGDATCDELEHWTGISHQTASARIRELVLLGRIHDSGRRRPTRSGRMARVYVVNGGSPVAAIGGNPSASSVNRVR